MADARPANVATYSTEFTEEELAELGRFVLRCEAESAEGSALAHALVERFLLGRTRTSATNDSDDSNP